MSDSKGEDKITELERKVAETRKNMRGAKGHMVAIAATNHYLRAKEELDRARATADFNDV